ncbi:PAS domain-containing protein [Paenirhodobacter sp. CAU 1674]|uniref:PAS domain-containing protein n=1 Tax=Paenirhodobacter sp. CAU 1674 TaxID=3032596 RepID=UPI0023DBCAB8|nr:PAS domain-containing protein [Paenirhodobacter sp. CAU 1674]MDF2142501.1 PAS domain-containing protein [Paenirhodobacter sp. CAU 1674]
MTARKTDRTAMTDLLSADGRIVQLCRTQETALGLAPGAATGAPWSLIYPLEAREQLTAALAAPAPGPHVVALDLRRADGAMMAVSAVIERVEHPEHGTCLDLTKWPAGSTLDEVAHLAEANEILTSILATSDDAGWCMEWADPVDLSAPEQEIIRQVFENGPRWRFCNGAMARLYRTPEGEDFNARPVHETFPRTEENEAFVRGLVRASFDINAQPSRDLRYDGVYIEVENDVRGHIRGNRLYRMWGTVRDVSKHARRAAVLRDEIDTLEAILAALPDAVLVVDRAGHVLRANLAAEELLGLSSETLPARELGDLIEMHLPLSQLFTAADAQMPGHPNRIFAVAVCRPDAALRAEMTARPLRLRETDFLVLSLRARIGTAGAGGGAPRVARLRAEG